LKGITAPPSCMLVMFPVLATSRWSFWFLQAFSSLSPFCSGRFVHSMYFAALAGLEDGQTSSRTGWNFLACLVGHGSLATCWRKRSQSWWLFSRLSSSMSPNPPTSFIWSIAWLLRHGTSEWNWDQGLSKICRLLLLRYQDGCSLHLWVLHSTAYKEWSSSRPVP